MVQVAPLLAMVPDWKAFFNIAMPEEELGKLHGTSALVARSETRHSLDGSKRCLAVPSSLRNVHRNRSIVRIKCMSPEFFGPAVG